MRVVIIGSGNVANVLGLLLQKHYEIIQVVGRNKKTVKALAKKLNCGFCFSIQAINAFADVYIIATNDNSIVTISSQLKLPSALVLHTSGTTCLQTLEGCSKEYGIIWPIQTISKNENPASIPFVIDAVNSKVQKKIASFISPISSNIQTANDSERIKIHLSAVIANNFVNHTLSLLQDFCDREKIDVQLLDSILNQTVKIFLNKKSKSSQTGPAVRKDSATIKIHQKVLASYPKLLKHYNQFTKSIQTNNT